MLNDPTFWALVSFIGFFALIIYLKAPAMISGALDKRAADIASELDEAQRLREEAQELLSEYQRKQREAEKESENIIGQAKEEAELMAQEAKEKLAESLERRTKQAEDKIAQAETQALKEVRNIAADVAIEAAERIISSDMSKAQASKLIEDGLKTVKSAKLN